MKPISSRYCDMASSFIPTLLLYRFPKGLWPIQNMSVYQTGREWGGGYFDVKELSYVEVHSRPAVLENCTPSHIMDGVI